MDPLQSHNPGRAADNSCLEIEEAEIEFPNLDMEDEVKNGKEKEIHRECMEKGDKDNGKKMNEKETQSKYDGNEIQYLPAYKAALIGDWGRAKRIFDDPTALKAHIAELSEAALLVAVRNTGIKGGGNRFNKTNKAGGGEKKNKKETDEKREDINYVRYLELHQAAVTDDWRKADRICESNPRARTASITEFSDTLLHVVIQTGGSIDFIKKLVDAMPEDSLLQGNKAGNTALHNAAIAGNTEVAKVLVSKNPKLPQQRNNYYDSPLHRAAAYCHDKTVEYLLSVTRNEEPSPFVGKDGAKLLNLLIIADFYKFALHLVKGHPMLALEEDPAGRSALVALAQKPKAFSSTENHHLACCQRLLHKFFARNSRQRDINDPQIDEENPALEEKKHCEFLQYLRNKKHIRAIDLLDELLTNGALKSNASKATELLSFALETAARLGNYEFVKRIIKHYPRSALHRNADWHNIFHLAVIHRHEKIYNLLYQMDALKYFAIGMKDITGNNILHLAGKYKPSDRISGAALQMQRELQWFEAVENVVQPSFREANNKEGKSPREMFTETHKELVKEGEEWMKGTANSSSVVAALVVTVMFAAAFTVPGGNKGDEGIPIFLNETSFIIFAVSDILGLFSSATSLLMFLGMLTSRYSQDDFHKALPRKLAIGLVSLFFSLASMLVTFSASIHILLSQRMKWIWIPVGVLALIPVALFAFMQGPLLVEIVRSTFGPSIFHRQSKGRIF